MTVLLICSHSRYLGGGCLWASAAGWAPLRSAIACEGSISVLLKQPCALGSPGRLQTPCAQGAPQTNEMSRWSSGAEFLTIPRGQHVWPCLSIAGLDFVPSLGWKGLEAPVAVAGWLTGWPILGGDSFGPWVRPCLPDLVWAAASPALRLTSQGVRSHVLATQGSWRSLDSCLLRQCWRGCPRPLTSLPQVCGWEWGRRDGLSAEGKGTGRSPGFGQSRPWLPSKPGLEHGPVGAGTQMPFLTERWL